MMGWHDAYWHQWFPFELSTVVQWQECVMSDPSRQSGLQVGLLKLLCMIPNQEKMWVLKQEIFHTSTGSEITLSWSPMRLKILHWQPEFHSWSPHFPIWRLKKKGQSPVGACLKKLISDPSSSNHMVDDHDVWGKCRDQIALRKSDHTCQAFN